MSGTSDAKNDMNTNHSVEGDLLAYSGIVKLEDWYEWERWINYIGIYKEGAELAEVILGVGIIQVDHHQNIIDIK